MFLTSRATITNYVARGWWDGISVDELFQRQVVAGADALALVDPLNRLDLDGQAPQRISWSALGDRVERLSAALLGADVGKDDVIATQLPNIVEAVLLFLACSRIGAILTPVVMQYREHELGYILDQTEPRLFITVPRFGSHDHAAMAMGLAESRPGMRVLLFNAPGDARDLDAMIATAESGRVTDYITAHPTDGGEVLTICWTSGTEARPKGVPRDHNHWVLNAKVVAEAGEMLPGETLLNPFPLVNIGSIGGLVMPWLQIGGRLVLHHPFNLPVFLQQIAEERVNYTIAPPAVLTALLQQPKLIAATDIGSLRAIGSGSAPLSPWLISGWLEQHGIQICNIFGSNEGASLFSSPSAVPDPAERARYFPRFGAEGVDWPGFAAQVIRTRLTCPASGEEVTTPGVPAELRIAGGTTFSGYWRQPI